MLKVRELSATAKAPSVQYIDIPIDHFHNATKDTFKNRYWYNDTFYEPNGPVVVMDVGEGNAEPFVPFLEEAQLQSAVMQVARRYKGIGVIWEHRYYGESIPFLASNASWTGALPARQWKFHTVDQALEDVVYFSKRFRTAKASASTLNPSKTPWIFMGGSYPGVRAALLRVRNPETIYASWASSAPVQAQVNMSSYWGTIERSLPRNCSNDFVAITKYANEMIAKNDTESARFKQAVYYAGSGGTNISLASAAGISGVSVGSWLRTPLNGWQNRGLAGAQPSCDFLQTANKTRPATSAGVFATRPTNVAVQEFLAMIYSLAKLNQKQSLSQFTLDTNVLGLAADEGNILEGRAVANENGDTKSWTYQWCSQFGFVQGANPNNTRSIQVNALSMDYYLQTFCQKGFPSGAVPPSPDVGAVLKYGGWNMNPSRTMFTNGDADPWSSLGVSSVEYNSPKRKANQTIPSVNGHFDKNTYFGLVYEKQVHAKDLARFSSSSKQDQDTFNKGLSLFTAALDQWLPKFGPGYNH